MLQFNPKRYTDLTASDNALVKNVSLALVKSVKPKLKLFNEEDYICDDETKLGKSELKDEIAEIVVCARVKLLKGDVESANKLLKIGSKLCKKYNYEKGLTDIYNVSISIALSKGDIEWAESLILTIIKNMTQNGTPFNDDKVVNLKLKLARIYSSYGENDFAEVLFRTCYEIQSLKIKQGNVPICTGNSYVKILFWYGVHMIRNFRFASGKGLIDKAYDYSKIVKNNNTPYYLVV